MLSWCYLCSQNSGTIKMNSEKKPWTLRALLLVLVLDDEGMLSVRRYFGYYIVTGRGEMFKKASKKSLVLWEGFSVFQFRGLFLGEKVSYS